ncbi:MAG: hypothetical protein QXR84_06025 [Candidatus Bathyarchaeia archaeon]
MIAVLGILGNVLNMFTNFIDLVLVVYWFFYFPMYVLSRLLGMMIAFFGLLVYFNLLKGKRWAWISALVLNSISIIMLPLLLMASWLLIPGLIYSILVLVYLLTPSVRSYFKKPEELPSPPPPPPSEFPSPIPIKPIKSRRRELEEELEKTINYLNRLEQEKDKISKKAYEKLKEEYLAKVERLKEEINEL